MEKVIIGNAELYCGDCLEVLPEILPNSIDMIWTDPPYGHKNHDGDLNAGLNELRGLENKPIANDDARTMRKVVNTMLIEAVRIMKHDCCCCCCCCGGGPKPTFAWLAKRMDMKGLSFFHSVIWDKLNPGLGWRYRRQHEMVMVAHIRGGKLLWANDKIATPNIIKVMPPRDRVHPNEKPLKLVEHFILMHTNKDAIVMDPFMGSGTTGVACADLGRKFIGIEKDRFHFETAITRLKDAQQQLKLAL